MSKVDVVLTYGWNRVCYNVLRSLATQGLKVMVGDTTKFSMSLWSKYKYKAFFYESFHKKPELFISQLIKIISNHQPEVYIPIHEETFVVAKYIDKFKDCNVKIPISDFNTLKLLHKKNTLMNLAVKSGIPVPLTIQPKDENDIKHFSQNVKFPIVIKLLNTNSAKGVMYVNSIDELLYQYEKLVKDLKKEEYPILQEYVKGDGYGVSLLLNNGELRAKFTHKRLREKIATGGTSTKRMSVKNDQLEEYAITLLKKVKYHGVAMVEFKYDENEKKGWLIEVNPRFWGSLALAIQSGVDFPYLLYKMAIDGDVKPVLNYKEGVIVRWILGDILATISYIKSQKSLKPLIEFFSFKNEKYDDFYFDDILPFFGEIFYYFSKFIKTGSANPTEDALLNIDSI